MNKPLTTADLIGQYIKLRDAVAVKTAIHECNGMMAEDMALLDLVKDPQQRTHEFLAKLISRFEYLATGTGAYQAAMTAIEQKITEQMNDSGETSIKTEQGTAYRSEWMAARVTDREMWMDWVFDGRHEGFLTNHVSKEAVKEYIDETGAIPAGLDVTKGYKTLFRKPSA
jgi:hypothetical protein